MPFKNMESRTGKKARWNKVIPMSLRRKEKSSTKNWQTEKRQNKKEDKVKISENRKSQIGTEIRKIKNKTKTF